MKTDLKSLLQTVCSAAASLTEDRVELDATKPINDQDAIVLQNAKGLIGHTISGLHGIETNLRGLLGEEVQPVARQKKKVQTPAPAAPAETVPAKA